MAIEVSADALGEEWKGCQGFPMKQSVLTPGRVRLPRRTGGRKHKSVWGCIVDANLSIPDLKDVPGLADTTVPHLGPKRTSRIHKLFSLSKEDPLNREAKKPRTKAPKIQRLVTPAVQQHKCQHIALKKQCSKKNKKEATEYAKLLARRVKEAKEKCQDQIAKRCRLSSLRASTSESS
uniref:Small ribosomal subunit protein eS6 n=1 Tax=Propithecus coquereli TaxID=379532 RepID=A0A2K6FUS5_PROCO